MQSTMKSSHNWNRKENQTTFKQQRAMLPQQGFTMPTSPGSANMGTVSYPNLKTKQQQQQTQQEKRQRVFTGTVTKLLDKFGFVDEDVFFQTACVKGPMPEVGDQVLVEAQFKANMPFEWNATSVKKTMAGLRPPKRPFPGDQGPPEYPSVKQGRMDNYPPPSSSSLGNFYPLDPYEQEQQPEDDYYNQGSFKNSGGNDFYDKDTYLDPARDPDFDDFGDNAPPSLLDLPAPPTPPPVLSAPQRRAQGGGSVGNTRRRGGYEGWAEDYESGYASDNNRGRGQEGTFGQMEAARGGFQQGNRGIRRGRQESEERGSDFKRRDGNSRDRYDNFQGRDDYSREISDNFPGRDSYSGDISDNFQGRDSYSGDISDNFQGRDSYSRDISDNFPGRDSYSGDKRDNFQGRDSYSGDISDNFQRRDSYSRDISDNFQGRDSYYERRDEFQRTDKYSRDISDNFQERDNYSAERRDEFQVRDSYSKDGSDNFQETDDIYGDRSDNFQGRDSYTRHRSDNFQEMDDIYGDRSDSFHEIDDNYGDRSDNFQGRDSYTRHRSDNFHVIDDNYDDRSDNFQGRDSYTRHRSDNFLEMDSYSLDRSENVLRTNSYSSDISDNFQGTDDNYRNRRENVQGKNSKIRDIVDNIDFNLSGNFNQGRNNQRDGNFKGDTVNSNHRRNFNQGGGNFNKGGRTFNKHSCGNFNHGGEKFNIESGGKFNTQGGGKFNTQGGGKFNTQGGGKFNNQDGGKFKTQGNGKFNTQSGGKFNTQGGGKFNNQGVGKFNNQGGGKFNNRGGGKFNNLGGGNFNRGGGKNQSQGLIDNAWGKGKDISVKESKHQQNEKKKKAPPHLETMTVAEKLHRLALYINDSSMVEDDSPINTIHRAISKTKLGIQGYFYKENLLPNNKFNSGLWTGVLWLDNVFIARGVNCHRNDIKKDTYKEGLQVLRTKTISEIYNTKDLGKQALRELITQAFMKEGVTKKPKVKTWRLLDPKVDAMPNMTYAEPIHTIQNILKDWDSKPDSPLLTIEQAVMKANCTVPVKFECEIHKLLRSHHCCMGKVLFGNLVIGRGFGLNKKASRYDTYMKALDRLMTKSIQELLISLPEEPFPLVEGDHLPPEVRKITLVSNPNIDEKSTQESKPLDQRMTELAQSLASTTDRGNSITVMDLSAMVIGLTSTMVYRRLSKKGEAKTHMLKCEFYLDKVYLASSEGVQRRDMLLKVCNDAWELLTTTPVETILKRKRLLDKELKDDDISDVVTKETASEDSAVPTTGQCASLKDSVSHIGPVVGTDAECKTSDSNGTGSKRQNLPKHASIAPQLISNPITITEKGKDHKSTKQQKIDNTEDDPIDLTEDLEEDTAEDTGDIAKDIVDIAEDIEDIAEDIEDIAEDIEDIAEDIEDIAEDIEDIAEDIEDIAEDIEDIAEDIEDIAEDSEDNAEDIKDFAEDQEEFKIKHSTDHLDALYSEGQSRKKQIHPWEWTLHKEVVNNIFSRLGTPMVDLFATRGNNRLPLYVSPVYDPAAWAVDAFSVSWDRMQAYAFPPTDLLSQTLKKIRESSCKVLLIAPVWPKNPWFKEILSLLVDHPRRLPKRPDLLSQSRGVLHTDPEVYHLHVWPLSSNLSERKAFRQKLPLLSNTRKGNPLEKFVFDNRIISSLPL